METPKSDLSELLTTWFDPLNPLHIRHLTLSSKNVVPGSLFFALPGYRADGRLYIDEAINAGASAVAVEGPPRLSWIGPSQSIPCIHIPHLRKKISAIAGDFYRHPSQQLKLIGITGTNGKTTISHLVAQWSNLLQYPSAVIGTLGYGALEELLEPAHTQQHHETTPSPIYLQELLHGFLEKAIKLVTLEMSSHGIEQSRGLGLTFEVGAITNITPEHLDYHGDFETYAATKRAFFQTHEIRHSVCNIDDPEVYTLAQQLEKPTYVSLQPERLPNFSNARFIRAIKSHYSTSGTHLQCTSSWGDAEFYTTLLGPFNGTNLLIAAACMLELGFSLDQLASTSSKLTPITGRLEKFSKPGMPTIFIDYAHTPDALEKALKAVRKLTSHRLICIFGCAGERDSIKRPIMGRIAERYADMVILTDDNPRGEDPKSIFGDILRGTINPKAIRCIHHRGDALAYGFKQCQENDVLLIAGKGHEKIQVYAHEILAMSDHEMVKTLLESYESSLSNH